MIKKLFVFTVIMLWASFAFSQNTIQGKITNTENNKPLHGAHVYLPELKKGTTTSETGTFELKDLPGGSHRLQVTFLGYQSVVKVVKPAEEKQVNIALKPTIIHSQEVIITAGAFSTQHENAIKIESIKTEEIENEGHPTLLGNLESVAGVDMISKSSGIKKPVIRGLSNSNVIFLNDGIKLENFQFSENHPYLFDPSDAGRIEVIKGPASLLYGSNAVGGLINIIDENPAPSGEIHANLKQEYYSNTGGLRTTLKAKGTSENYYWKVGGNYNSHKDFTSGAGTLVPNSRFNNQSFSATTGLLTRSGTYEVSYDYAAKNLGMTVPPALSLVDSKNRENNYWYQDLTNHLVKSKTKTFLGNYKLDTRLSFQQNNRLLRTVDAEAVDMTLNTVTYDVKTHFPSSGKEVYIAGFQGNFKENTNGSAPNHVLPDHTSQDFALYGLVQYPINGKLQLQTGLRYDLRKIDIPEQKSSGNPQDTTMTEALNKNYDNLSGSAGLTWHLNEKWLFRANFSSGYRTPNTAELAQQGIHGNRYETGNRELQSQRNYETDLNIHYHCCHMMVDVAAYYNSINDYIFLSPTDETISAGNGTQYDLYRYLQTDATIQGFEVSYEINPLPWLNTQLNYSFIRAEQDDGTNLPFIPQDKVKIRIKAERDEIGFLKKPNLNLSARYAFEQDRPSRFETSTGDYLVLDAGFGTAVNLGNQKLMAGVRVNNLLDEAYFDHLSTLKPLGFHQTGRNIQLWLQLPLRFK